MKINISQYRTFLRTCATFCNLNDKNQPLNGLGILIWIGTCQEKNRRKLDSIFQGVSVLVQLYP